MIHPFFLSFISVTTLTSLFIFPTHGTATCDLDKISISLDVNDKLVTEILKDIERQTEYTFELQGNKTLTNKKSIKLDQTPLDLTLNRLLTGLSYSAICNNDKKLITLALLDNNRSLTSASKQRNTAGIQTNGMEGLSEALDDFRSNKSTAVNAPQQVPEEMKGLSKALQDYSTSIENNTITTKPNIQKTSMDAATEALDQYNNKSTSEITPAENSNSGEMAGLAAAIKEYREKPHPEHSALPAAQQTRATTTMDGATTAMEEYKKIHNNH
jgi:hypothetical protein